MRRRTVIWSVLITLGLMVVSPIAFVAFYFATSGGSGSPEEAVRLKAMVESIPDPESGEGIDREYRAERFPNGEWVLGFSRDSHGWLSAFRGGGTVVIKDSSGRVRCYFGHVCGPGGHQMYLRQAQSADDFYKKLTEYKTFTEYQWP